MAHKLNIAIAGLGTVGCGIIEILNKNKDSIALRSGKQIEILAVSSRTKNKSRYIDNYLENIKWYDNPLDLADDNNIDIIIETIGGESGIAYELCRKALKNKKHVITANKALIAVNGFHLSEIAEKNKVSLSFEAAVAGGIPAVKTLKEGLSANNIKSITGILNGTCNYILSKMEESSKSFEEVLKEAQKLGYAEADPKFDIEGIDAAHKLAILASIAFGNKVFFDYYNLHTQGITDVTLSDIKCAKELGYKIKLLAVAKQHNNVITQQVYPALLRNDHDLAQVNGVKNAVHFDCDYCGEILITGAGAGSGPTASAVISDIIDISSNRLSKSFAISSSKQFAAKFGDINEHFGSYFIRVNVEDKSGILAEITEIFKSNSISVKCLLQNPDLESLHKENIVQVIGITHDCNERNITSVVNEIAILGGVINKPHLIRVY